MGSMPRLNTATTFQHSADEKGIEVKYKTGASFVGSVENYKKTGSGIFTWPNGSKYEGDYSDNLRHGKGVQTWSDGSRYEGDFLNDYRHGQGSICWANGEAYEGAFFKDRRHGKGTYRWPDHSSFTGTFYMDKKEGYGVFTLVNGDVFEGLYKDDEREGPGVVSYTDGRQDVGIWRGEQLIKLVTSVEGGFSMKNHSEFMYEEEDMMMPVVGAPDRTEPLKNILHPPALFNYAPEVKVSERISELYSEDLDPRSLAINRQAFDEEFFKEWSSSGDKEPSEILVWNKTPTLVDIQMHTHKHRRAAADAGFDVDKVLKFDRTGFKPAGPLEQASEELLRMAAAGNCKGVEELLNTGKVHPDVADKNGHTALIAATVNWHQDIINVLLNQGANVNQLSDEGVSVLAAGTVFYYPSERFVRNIAERNILIEPLVQASTATLGGQNMPESPSVPLNPIHDSRAGLDRQLSPVHDSHTRLDHPASRRGSQINRLNRQKSIDAANRMSASDAELAKMGMRKEGSQVRIMLSQDSRNTVFEHEQTQGDQKASDVKDSEKDSVPGKGETVEEEKEAVVEREEFESNVSVHNYQIEVTDNLVERCATQLSMNERVVSREAVNLNLGKARNLAVQISQHERMKETLELLLRRGADPNASRIPMPVLFFAIKAADINMVRKLLLKGASTTTVLGKDKGGLAPLHIAAALPVEEGVEITELLLNALANPDVRALKDDSFLNRNLVDEWSKDPISDESAALLGGRTPLQLACARDDNYKNATKVVTLLLRHKANPNLLCNGFSPLALAIASGNDSAVDELLLNGANPSLPLTHGVGSSLCAASSTEYEHRRPIQHRINLIDKLVGSGADILAPIPIGPKRQIGTAVDYAYYMFNQDRRIAHMPYHALTPQERETYNARKKLLAHLGDILRGKAVEREKKRREEEERIGRRSASPSAAFVYTGAGDLPPLKKATVKFEGARAAGSKETVVEPAAQIVRKPLFKYCYECGRSVGVRLSACTRCKEVYYCSKACKLKAWNSRHKEECLRVPGKTSPKGGADSPGLDVDSKGAKDKKNLRITGLSKSAGSRSRSRGRGDGKKKQRELSPHAAAIAALLEQRRAKTAFMTEDGRWVYIDNYSYN